MRLIIDYALDQSDPDPLGQAAGIIADLLPILRDGTVIEGDITDHRRGVVGTWRVIPSRVISPPRAGS